MRSFLKDSIKCMYDGKIMDPKRYANSFFTEKDYYEHLERLGVKDREKNVLILK